MNPFPKFVFLSIVSLLAACGRGDKAEGPPSKAGLSKSNFSLENGVYYIDHVWNIQDGCGRDVLAPDDPITNVAFNLENGGDGRITIDRCVFDDRSTSGVIQDNEGTLSVLHTLRRDRLGEDVAEYQQECQLQVYVRDDNTLEANFTERQRNRNTTARRVMADGDECSTSYKFTMSKRDSF